MRRYDDPDVQGALQDHIIQVQEADAAALQEVFADGGRSDLMLYRRLAEVVRSGSSAFSRVYESVWHTVRQSELYDAVVANIMADVRTANAAVSGGGGGVGGGGGGAKPRLHDGLQRLPEPTMLALFVQAAHAKPLFDGFMAELNERFGPSSRYRGLVTVPHRLKKVERVAEKVMLKGRVVGILDVVRGMICVPTMRGVASVLQYVRSLCDPRR